MSTAVTFLTIELRGRHAVGASRFAVVDPENFERLNRHRWKAKPNGPGNHVYAVRNTVMNGRNVTVRMHREIMGIPPGDAAVVDHLNGNALDNRKANLRVGTQRDNMRQARVESLAVACTACGSPAVLVNRLAILTRWRNGGWTCPECRKPDLGPKAPITRTCRWCASPFEAKNARHFYCSPACRSDYRAYAVKKLMRRRGPYNTPRRAIRMSAIARFSRSD